MADSTQYQLAQVDDDALWSECLRHSPERSAFAEPWFLACFGECRAVRYSVRKGEELLLCLIVWIDADGRAMAGPMPYTQYQGFFFTNAFHALPMHSRATAAHHLLSFAIEQLSIRFDRLCFSSHWAHEDLRAFSWFNYHAPELGKFRIDPFYSGLVPLESFDAFESFLSSIRKTRRQEYGKRAAYKITEAGAEAIPSFLNLYRATFARQGLELPRAQLQRVEAICKGALEAGRGSLLTCSAGGSMLSGALILFDDRYSYYLLGASDPERRELPGGTLVILEAIKMSMDRGLKGFDVCGMNSPSRGDFKAGFGPLLKLYQVLSWARP